MTLIVLDTDVLTHAAPAPYGAHFATLQFRRIVSASGDKGQFFLDTLLLPPDTGAITQVPGESSP